MKRYDTAPKLKGEHSIDYPVFCFKHLQRKLIKNCDDKLFRSFIERLSKLGELGWKEISKSDRHSYGFELIDKSNIKPQLPMIISADIQSLYVFRYTGNNHSFLAIRNDNILHVIFIEANFGDVYNHN
ncbi:MAG: hypothetical protein LBO74_07585 [Candidatus Symbiothrix sp.]|nr:hypothetical protein [Candidatus Symbiothrix sp.]